MKVKHVIAGVALVVLLGALLILTATDAPRANETPPTPEPKREEPPTPAPEPKREEPPPAPEPEEPTKADNDAPTE